MRRALGKGLDALLPVAPGLGAATDGEPSARGAVPVALVPVSAISPNPEQPRWRFEDEALGGLTESIKMHGLLQPLLVRQTDGGYELIAGERRLRASVAAGLSEVPVVIRDAERLERVALALIENVQREDLSPLEEAQAYRRLVDEFGLTQEEVARRVGKSRPAVANALRLLSLPDRVKAQVEAGELSAGHARAVLTVEGDAERVAFAREIAAAKVPKREAERLAAARRTGAKGAREGRPGTSRAAARDPHWRAMAEQLTRQLGTRVRLNRRTKGGTIEIEFYSDAELDRLLGRLGVAP